MNIPLSERESVGVLLDGHTLPSVARLQEINRLSAQQAERLRLWLERYVIYVTRRRDPWARFDSAHPGFPELRAELLARGVRLELIILALRETQQRSAQFDGGTAAVDPASLRPLATDMRMDTETDSGPNQPPRVRDGAIQADGQKLYTLVYHIAEERARNEGYVHRGVTCNSCGTIPIRGIRYRCANCADFDLCEHCESQSPHQKTHLFYKVRIPAPFLGNPRQSQPVIYPGRRHRMPEMLDAALRDKLTSELVCESSELDATYDQFGCLAASEWPNDQNKIGWAIDLRTFYKCFIPNSSMRAPKPNLIYDRLFALYDTNRDGLIGFEEFARGLACISNKTKEERRKRVFNAFDLDEDGLVDRKDFLRMFRAYYALTRDLTSDVVAGWEDEAAGYEETQRVIMSGGPLTAAFTTTSPFVEDSRAVEGKHVDEYGDMVLNEREEIRVTTENGTDRADRNEVLSELLNPERVASEQSRVILAASDDDVEEIIERVLEVVVSRANRAPSDAAAADASAGNDEQNVEEAVAQERLKEHWRRKEFYLDEEEGFAPPKGLLNGTANEDSDYEGEEKQETAVNSAASPRSRSSSKVRFQDETDFLETRSNTSTNSRPFNERWGGYEVPEAERDIGREILYQVTQEGLNEMLDPVFKAKEDIALEVRATRRERQKWAKEIEEYAKERALQEEPFSCFEELSHLQDPLVATAKAQEQKESQRTISTAASSNNVLDRSIVQEPLEELLESSGYSTTADISAPIEDQRPADPSSHTPAQENSSENPYQNLDPTMPQNRPNDLPSSRSSHSQPQTQAASSSPTTPPSPDETPPSVSRLAHLLTINRAAEEIKLRGGKAGTLDYAEFLAMMIADERNGTKDKYVFGVVSSWIEIGSF